MESIAGETNAISLSFDTRQAIVPATQSETFARLATSLDEYAALAEILGLEPRLSITGHSDGSGTDATNISLEHQRAEYVAAALLAEGAEARWISTLSQLETQAPGVRAPQVTLRLEAVASSSSAGRD